MTFIPIHLTNRLTLTRTPHIRPIRTLIRINTLIPRLIREYCRYRSRFRLALAGPSAGMKGFMGDLDFMEDLDFMVGRVSWGPGFHGGGGGFHGGHRPDQPFDPRATY